MTKALSLISGGIDSPVATYLMMKKDLDILCIHFDNYPYGDKDTKDKVVRHVQNLSKMFSKKIKLYIVNHGINHSEFIKNTNRRYTCIFCKRMMLRIAEKIAEKEGCRFLITGENLGQVASQTLDNMAIIESAVKIPVLRPLLTNDKQETIDLAKNIGTFEVSIERGVCCTAVPTSPTTKAKKSMVEREEQRVDVKKLIEDAVNSAEIMIINP